MRLFPAVRFALASLMLLSGVAVADVDPPRIHSVSDISQEFTFYMDGRFHRQYLAEHGTECLAERVAERLAEQGAEHGAERIAERVADRVAQHVSHRVTERIAQRVANRVAQRVA